MKNLNLNHRDFDLKDFNDMKSLPSLDRNDIKDHVFRAWSRIRTTEGKVYLPGAKGVSVHIKDLTLAANQDLIYAVERCLSNFTEIWQSVTGDRYIHNYLDFYDNGILMVQVSFAHNKRHQVDSVKFITRNPDEIRKGTLYSIAAR